MGDIERIETVVVGGGQAGLATGYHLARLGRRFVVLDAGGRPGDAWRARWDSLRLFTPARYDALPGLAFPAPGWSFPTKDEMAAYLEGYAERFQLPVHHGARVERLSAAAGGYLVEAGGRCWLAANVVIATGPYQVPRLPAFAAELDKGIVSLHSAAYRNPGQLAPGAVLVVGAGNSGADIGIEAARAGHQVTMAGRDVGHLPFDIEGAAARFGLARLFLRGVFHRVLTVRTPLGRRAKPRILGRGGPLIRLRPADLAAAGVQRAPRVAGVRGGLPVLDGGRVLEVANVVWCTGFGPDFGWVDLPGFERDAEPAQHLGAVDGRPGLFVVGRHFQYSLSSTMVHGVGRDAARVAAAIAARGAEVGGAEVERLAVRGA